MRLILFLMLFVFSSCSSAGDSSPQDLIHHETFGSGGNCGFDTKYWTGNGSTFFTESHYEPLTNQKKYLETPDSPGGGCFLNYFIKAGTDEIVPARLEKQGEISEIYLEFYIYFKAGFSYPGGLKLARIGKSDRNDSMAYLEYNYSNGDPQVVLYTYDNVTQNEYYTGNFSYKFPEDEWIKIGFWHKDSTPNVANGFTVLYINDSEIANSGQQITRSTSVKKDFFWVGGNHSWGAGTGEGGQRFSSKDSNMFIDDVKVYNRRVENK